MEAEFEKNVIYIDDLFIRCPKGPLAFNCANNYTILKWTLLEWHQWPWTNKSASVIYNNLDLVSIVVCPKDLHCGIETFDNI